MRHSFQIVQQLPVSVRQAWNFFSNPENLQLITPSDFQFKILTPLNGSIYPGQVIDYTVRPLFSIRMKWRTIITKVDHEVMFVDEQQKGPYRYWQHQHYFRPFEGGTEMTDTVSYEVPGAFFGDILNKMIIKKKLKDLFDYRSTQITRIVHANNTNWN